MNINQFCCKEMERHLFEGEVAIKYLPKFRSYGIKILDGGTSIQKIKFCPWCGQELLKSLRDDWFDMLEKIGFHDPLHEEVPQEFQTDEWWKKRKL